MIRIIEPEHYCEEAIKVYSSLGEVSLGHEVKLDEATKVIVIRLNYYIGSSFLESYPNLETIISPTTGVNHVDVELVRRKKIRLITLRDVADKLSIIKSTSEHTLMMAIAINRCFGLYMYNYKVGGAPKIAMRDSLRGKELSHQNLGILGFGRIGKHVYEMGNLIWKKVKVWDIDDEALNQFDTRNVAQNLQELFEFADTLCICINYTEKNIGFVGKDLLKSMKKGSCIVNTSRGEVIDEKLVIEMLKNGHLYGYATDVISKELNQNEHVITSSLDSPLNLLYTPHVGGCTKEAMETTELILSKYFSKI